MDNFSWPLFFILFAGSLISGIAIMPYAVALNPQALETIKAKQAGKARPLSPTLAIFLSGAIQSAVLGSVSTFIGLKAASAVGLKLPVLQAILTGGSVLDPILAFLPAVLVIGVATALILFGLDRYVFLPRVPAVFSQTSSRISFWKRAMTPLYGGFNEEILLRLFVMSGLAWLIGLVWKTAAGTPAVGALWLANFLATLLFGLGHLPATRSFSPLTPMVVTRALVMNGLAGLVFGYLFITYGLEAAMLAHFCLDIVIHLVIPDLIPAAPAAQTAPAP